MFFIGDTVSGFCLNMTDIQNQLSLYFFINALYAPIYYYRVKIKKRPLRNKINRPQEIETEDKSISEEEFVDLNRNNVFGVIDLWASKENQLDYQKNVPIAQVSAELFCQWEDFYFPHSDDFKQSFSKEELELLSEFDTALNNTIDETPQNLPVIEEFIKTEEWKKMNEKAIEIKKKINTVGNTQYSQKGFLWYAKGCSLLQNCNGLISLMPTIDYFAYAKPCNISKNKL